MWAEQGSHNVPVLSFFVAKKQYLTPTSSDRHLGNKRTVQCQDCLPADGWTDDAAWQLALKGAIGGCGLREWPGGGGGGKVWG